MEELLNRLEKILATPQLEDVRQEEIRNIVYEWRSFKESIECDW